jgi:hypothetical protein
MIALIGIMGQADLHGDTDVQASTEIGAGRVTSSIALSYPNAQAMNRNVFIGYSVGNIHRSPTNDDVIDAFRLFVLHYMV